MYFLHYMDACNKFDSKIELDKKVNLIIASFCPHQPPSSTLFSTPSRPFPPGNEKTSFSSCCLLCTKGGHSIVKHHGESKPSTFSDGRPTWAHICDQDLLTPSRQQICMSYNICGASRCSYAEDACTHICSAHHAFSYIYCPHPVCSAILIYHQKLLIALSLIQPHIPFQKSFSKLYTLIILMLSNDFLPNMTSPTLTHYLLSSFVMAFPWGLFPQFNKLSFI